LLVALAAMLIVAGPAGAKIVVQRGIGGANLHMTKAQVRARLGAPTRVHNGRNTFGHFSNFVYPRLTVMFQSGPKVTGVRTSSRLERTSSGVGVGSSVARVKAGVRQAKCRTQFGTRQCVVGKFLPGRVITAFVIRKGHVSSVIVGIVLD